MRFVMFRKGDLTRLYLEEKKSARTIARQHGCSERKVNYWLAKHNIPKRSISESIYVQRNPNGDPFSFKKPLSQQTSFLFGLGLGLYWGEGNKKNTHSIRLGNTDPALIKSFIQFLKEIYRVREEKFRFGLQIFSDMNPNVSLAYWTKTLGVSSDAFGKVIVTPARSIGTYREKSKHGVLTVYVSNKKLRDTINQEIEKLR